MHFFELRNIQHFVLYLFPSIISVFLIGAALAYSHFGTKRGDKKKDSVYYRYPDHIEDRHGPFPLVLTLVIVGTIIWGAFYILGTGLLGVKI